MKYRINHILLFFYLTVQLFSQGGYCQSQSWSHPFADPEGRAFLNLPLHKRQIQKLFDFEAISLPVGMIDLRSGDLDGDGAHEIVGVTLNRDSAWSADFQTDQSVKIDIPRREGEQIFLRALVDADNDSYMEILFSLNNPSAGTSRHIIFNQAQKCILYEIQSQTGIQNELAFTVLDANFDGQNELIAMGDKSLNFYSLTNNHSIAHIDLPGPVKDGNCAVVTDTHLRETRIYFATEPTETPATLFSYVIFQGKTKPEPLWSKPLIPDMKVQRLSVGKTIEGAETVILGTKRATDSAEPMGFLAVLSALEGFILNEINFKQADCVDMAVANLDNDEEMEITVLDSAFNLHRLDLSTNRHRIFTVLQAQIYIGSVNLDIVPFSDNPVLQVIGNRLLFHFLNDDFDPILSPPQITFRGELAGRPILGDADGNGVGEVIFSLKGDNPTLNRVFLFDPDWELPTPTLPSPTPTPVITPTPTPTVVSKVLNWINY